MQLFMSAFTHKLKAFADDSSGNATVEFVIIAPALFWLVFSVFEAGWLMTQQTMLHRGLNMAIRDLRLGKITFGTQQEMHDQIKARVCARARILRDCSDSIHLELQAIDLAEGVPNTSPSCVDRSEDAAAPTVNFMPGQGDQDIMFVRACVIVDPLLPGMGLGAQLTTDATGGYMMVAFSAFANEPSS